ERLRSCTVAPSPQRTFWYHLRKRLPIYAWPIVAGGVILIDWNHTREWKANGRVSVLDVQLLGKMGTFTVGYFVRKAFWEKKHYWTASVAAYWIGICWDRAGMAKAEMMKGHSRMYANRLAAIPKGADPWKY
ncbi:hypothetical protein PRIPAC_73499, partial [Pristionchus pacificus]|uniref:Uncharacterized protein n=1 Tax=Pristionchus pacificus TaxID=54126 RepID=A0A2A6C9T9_PRIPA